MEIKKSSHPPKRGEIYLVDLDPSITVFLDHNIGPSLNRIEVDYGKMPAKLRKKTHIGPSLNRIALDYRHMPDNLRKKIHSTEKKTYPAIIISNDINNRYSDTITVIPVSTQSGKVFPFEALLPSGKTGLKEKSRAICDKIRTINKDRLLELIGEISPEKIKEVEEALLLHLGIFL